MSVSDKLHKLEHALFDGSDRHAKERDDADQQRDAAAEAKLDKLESYHEQHDTAQQHGYGEKGLSNVPEGNGGHGGIDTYNQTHVEPPFKRSEVASNTALRPESQEMMDGTGTAGDDLAI